MENLLLHASKFRHRGYSSIKLGSALFFWPCGQIMYTDSSSPANFVVFSLRSPLHLVWCSSIPQTYLQRLWSQGRVILQPTKEGFHSTNQWVCAVRPERWHWGHVRCPITVHDRKVLEDRENHISLGHTICWEQSGARVHKLCLEEC